MTRELNKVYSLFFVVGLFGVDGPHVLLGRLAGLDVADGSMAVAMEWSCCCSGAGRYGPRSTGCRAVEVLDELVHVLIGVEVGGGTPS